MVPITDRRISEHLDDRGKFLFGYQFGRLSKMPVNYLETES